MSEIVLLIPGPGWDQIGTLFLTRDPIFLLEPPQAQLIEVTLKLTHK